MTGDVRYGLRRLLRAPGFTATAVLSLALGIGASTALFSLVNAALLRLIPVQRPEELMWFAVKPGDFGRVLNYPFYRSLDGDTRFAGLLCAFPAWVNLRAERVETELVSGTYFDTLGLRPHLGRLLRPDDDRVRLGHPVAVVSHAYWQSRLAGDPTAIGKSIEVNGMPYTLVGVAPPGFGGIEQGRPRSLFLPIQMKAQATPGWDGMDKPLIAWLWIVGRVKPGVDRQALGTEMNARLHAFQAPHLAQERRLTPAQRKIIQGRTVFLEPLRDAVLDSREKGRLSTLAWAVAALLLMTCANVAGLLLARGMERQREIATRLAIGASRGRIVWQLLAESSLVGIAGGVAGLVLGSLMASVVAARFPIGGAGSSFDTSVDWRVLLFAIVVTMAATLLFGLTPAMHATRLDLMAVIKAGAHSKQQRRFRLALVAGQVALATVLLAMAGIFTASLQRLFHREMGYQRTNLLLAELEPTLNGYDNQRRLQLYRSLDASLGSGAPGICNAALTNVAPMSPYTWSSLFLVEGGSTGEEIIPRGLAVGPGYFTTLGIPLRRGRLLTDRDEANAPRVALISESLARKAFPDSDPIGRRFAADYRDRAGTTFEIVGVVADVDLNDPRRQDGREAVYVPYRQWAFVPQAIVIQARLCGDTQLALASIRKAVRDFDAALALYDIRTVEAAAADLLVGERLLSLLSLFFGALAVLLVATGVYGVLVREIAMRTRELGIRLALGASRPALLWTLIREVTFYGGAGVLLGAGVALRLPGVATDWWAIPATIIFLTLLGLSTVAIAGRKTAGIDPATALRWD
ncbi:MAG: ABC transporter permease [Bryobacteraceae bacterium]